MYNRFYFRLDLTSKRRINREQVLEPRLPRLAVLKTNTINAFASTIKNDFLLPDDEMHPKISSGQKMTFVQV